METSPIPGMGDVGMNENQVLPPQHAPIINAPDTDAAIDQIPDDIDEFMSVNKIKKNGYVVHIKQKWQTVKSPRNCLENLPTESLRCMK